MLNIKFTPGIILQSVNNIDNETISTFIVYYVNFECIYWAHLRFPNKIYKYYGSWEEFLDGAHDDVISYHILMKTE